MAHTFSHHYLSRDLEQDHNLKWIDPFVEANYIKKTSDQTFKWGKKYGKISKVDGGYVMDNSLTRVHRGLCSRPGELSAIASFKLHILVVIAA